MPSTFFLVGDALDGDDMFVDTLGMSFVFLNLSGCAWPLNRIYVRHFMHIFHGHYLHSTKLATSKIRSGNKVNDSTSLLLACAGYQRSFLFHLFHLLLLMWLTSTPVLLIATNASLPLIVVDTDSTIASPSDQTPSPLEFSSLLLRI